jgi:hypothetical protein
MFLINPDTAFALRTSERVKVNTFLEKNAQKKKSFSFFFKAAVRDCTILRFGQSDSCQRKKNYMYLCTGQMKRYDYHF